MENQLHHSVNQIIINQKLRINIIINTQRNLMNLKQQLENELSVDVELHQHIVLVSSLLKDLINDNNLNQNGSIQPTIFDSKSVPDIPIDDYLRRVHKLTRFSPQSLIIAVIIMDRYMVQNENFTLSPLNVHRLLLSCLLLGVKIHDDFYYDNKAFQTAGGINIVMLEKYQVEVFSKCHYNLFVNSQEYNIFIENLYSVYANANDDSQTEDQY